MWLSAIGSSQQIGGSAYWRTSADEPGNIEAEYQYLSLGFLFITVL